MDSFKKPQLNHEDTESTEGNSRNDQAKRATRRVKAQSELTLIQAF